MKIKQHTVTCLFGNPVDHSVSDIMFGHFAEMAGVRPYTHLKLRIPDDNPENLKQALLALQLFGFAGANITLPYKQQILPHLDQIDATAERMGAVNTIVNTSDGIVGYNTDGLGALRAIEENAREVRHDDHVVIFGAGGAARAIISALAAKAGSIHILTRSPDLENARQLVTDFAESAPSIKTKELSDDTIVNEVAGADIIINATPVGMTPDENNSIVTRDQLDRVAATTAINEQIFFDAVFNPFTTKFLDLAEEYGARTVPGIYMMIYQGLEAFHYWTGDRVPTQDLDSLISTLQREIEGED